MYDNPPLGAASDHHKRSIVAVVLDEITRDTSGGRLFRFGDAQPAWVHKMRDASLDQSRDALWVCVTQMRDAGVTAACIAELYVPQVARRLGDEWCCDEVNFHQVTLGAARLQSLLWRLAPDWAHTGALVSGGRAPVLVAVPAGAQHTLGATVLAGQLRYRGVPVQVELGFDGGGDPQCVGPDRFAAVFISAAGCASLDHLARLVQRTRRSFPATPIVFGGNITDQMSDIQKTTGADLVTSDLEEAMSFCGLGQSNARPSAERAG